ncbi:MAG: outer membrane beta-barrel protein [Bacteroidetes bacterium]|nr:outer membrane beta-barrel protein [Bacteroidota bacterium]
MNRTKFSKAILTLFFVGIGFCSFIQTASAQFKAAIHLGMTGSSFRGGNLQNASAITRFGGGAAVRYEYPSGFELESGVFYVVKGSKLEGTYSAIPIEGTSEITYVEIPILFGYRFMTNRRYSPRIYAGPAMAFKTDAIIKFNAKGSDIVQQEDDLTVADKDLGIMVGVDVNTQFGSETLSFGIRSTFGYSNAREADPEIYNTSVALLVGIVF